MVVSFYESSVSRTTVRATMALRGHFFSISYFPLLNSHFPFFLNFPFPISHFPFLISHFSFPTSYFSFPISHQFPISHFPLPISHFLFSISFPFPISIVFHFSFPISHFIFPISHFFFFFSLTIGGNSVSVHSNISIEGYCKINMWC